MRVLAIINLALVTILFAASADVRKIIAAPSREFVSSQVAPAAFPWNPSVYAEPRTSPTFSAAKLGSSDKNVPYCLVGSTALGLDIFYPTTQTTTFPVVVSIHGGGFRSWLGPRQMNEDGTNQARAFINHGYAYVNLYFRGAPDYELPTMIQDVKCAIRHLRARAASYNINPDQIGVFGGSSGAYLAAMIGLADATAGFEGKGAYDKVSSRVQAVVANYPPVLVPPYSSAQEKVFPPNPTPEFLVAVSLFAHASKNAPPFLFFHGEFDPEVSPAGSLNLHAKLAAAGVDSTYVLVKRAGHGWNESSPRLPNTPYGPQPNSQEITKAQLDFLDKHLKK